MDKSVASANLPSSEDAFRAAEQSAKVDWEGLRAHLATAGMDLSLDPPPRQFSGGLANINFLISLNGVPAVLRRPPEGDLPPGAHDMGREHRILKNLYREFPLAPKGIYFCDDKSVIGAPFQFVEYRAGLVMRGDDPGPGRGRPDVAAQLSKTLIDVLVDLHAVDPAAVGLGDFGKPEGFVARNVKGWIKRARLAAGNTEPSASTMKLCAWLEDNAANDAAPVLLHNDVKLDNLILDPESLFPVALLDWDMGTRGHPLMDLATTLSYWTEPDDPDCMHELAQMPTAHDGFWRRREAAAHYADQTGADLADYRFFRVLAMFRLGVVFQQLQDRQAARGGGAKDYDRLGLEILDFAAEIAEGRAE